MEKKFMSMMEEKRVFDPPEELKKKAYITSMEQYKALYKRSVERSRRVLGRTGRPSRLVQEMDKVSEVGLRQTELKWFVGGKLNVSYNCLDGTWPRRATRPALIWQGEPVEESKTYTYQQLHYHVCKFANVLKKHGVKKG